jgi:osmotically-inducible protein OsmY
MAHFNLYRRIPAALLALTLTSAPAFTLAQDAQPSPTWSQEDTLRVVKDVQKKLAGLVNFSVFDWLSFAIEGKTIILKGYASRPTLKSDAENAVKKIPGVEKVVNEIEVLPNSPNDDRIRAAVYNRIYTQPVLRKYNANQGNLARAMGPGANIAAATSITNAPPIGFHSIHIIVKNGRVILYGYVNNKTDSDIAFIQANGTPNVFGVENELQFPTAPPKQPK